MQLVGGLFRNKRAIAPAAQESARIGSSRTGSFRIGSFRIGSFREGSKTDRSSGSAKMLQVATSGHESEEEYYDTCTSKFIPNAAADDQAPSDQERSSCTNRGAAAAADRIDNHVLLRKPSSNSKPHKANDMGWEAIQELRDRDGAVGLSHFKLVKRLGCGDIGSVYLCELRGTDCYFAMKVMDKGALAMRKKLARAQTEKEILASLDHPFLPTLYAHFETSQFSCLVMEYCSGGDLHSLRQKQTGKCFTDMAAKFYAAEVLLALEYLHMMGVVYRDLKPENVLVRADGHIMLSDFDLSLRCVVSPTLVMSPVLTSIPSRNSRHKLMEFTVEPNTVSLQSCVPIMSHRFLRTSLRKKSSSSSSPVQEKVVVLPQTTTRPELVVEPTEVRSMSFVGTHEYLAPEIISGDGHGSSVDWWTFGIFLYELLYAKTPFKGADNELTLTNVVSHPLLFPSNADAGLVPEAAKDLIRGLLVKDPMKRLGSLRGAGEIKSHSFFEGVNWALIRCALPPEIPKPQYRPVRSGKSVGTAAGEKKKAANGWKQEEEEEDVSHVVPEFQCF